MLLVVTSPLFAQEIAVIKAADVLPYREAAEGFKNTAGMNIVDYLLPKDSKDYNTISEAIQRSKPVLIFALGAEALRIAMSAAPKTPIVYSFVLNTDKDLADAMERHVVSLIGVSIAAPPLEQFKVLLRAKPKVHRIGVVYDPRKTPDLIDRARTAAASLGLELAAIEVHAEGEAVTALAQLEGKVDALWMVPDTTAISVESIKYMLLTSFRSKIPLVALSDKYVKQGALLALSFDSTDLGRQAGDLATAILHGKASGGRVVQPRRLLISLNAKTAEQIGLSLPEDLVKEAAQVYR